MIAEGWASVSEVRRWLLLSTLVAVSMLVGVLLCATLLPTTPSRGSSLLHPSPSWEEVSRVGTRNLLVLALHACACLVGIIVARPHHRRRRWDPPLPAWLGRVALLYTTVVTVSSVVLQTTALGLVLGSLSGGIGVSPLRLWLLVLPHALPELVALFLPLALFLLRARAHVDDRLRRWTWQAVAVALPLLLAAAVVETWVTPRLIVALLL